MVFFWPAEGNSPTGNGLSRTRMDLGFGKALDLGIPFGGVNNRWAWHAFFERYDLLVTPIMPTSAFPHDHRRFGERTIRIDDRDYPYFQQLFWAGLAGVAYLPSTVIPTGLDRAGLPIGVQLVGPEYGDLITIGVARALEADGYRFVPPPDCR